MRGRHTTEISECLLCNPPAERAVSPDWKRYALGDHGDVKAGYRWYVYDRLSHGSMGDMRTRRIALLVRDALNAYKGRARYDRG